MGIFAWLTPYGAAFVLFTFVVLFVYPPAELLKPLSTLTSRMRGLSVAGLRVEFSGDQVRSDKAEIQYSFAIIENLMRSHYATGAKELDLPSAFGDLVSKVVTGLGKGKTALEAEQFRATLHVPFYFGQESVFQILDYFDVNGRIIRSMPGSGRVFSIRKGIVGRAWREEIARYDPRVSMNPNELVSKWGMTQEEARSAAGERRRQTFLAVRILDEAKAPLAIVYMDAKADHVFEEGQSGEGRADDIDHGVNKARADKLQAVIQEQAQACGIVSKLKTLRETVGWNEEQRLLFTSAL